MEKSPKQMLGSRAVAAQIYGCSISKVIRLEREGLPPIRLGKSPRAQVHYSLDEIAKRAAGGRDDR